MKRILLSILLFISASAIFAQSDTTLSWKRIISFDNADIVPLFNNYYEVTYGFGLSEHNHYLGLNYTHRFDRLGVSASAIKGIGNKSISLLAGPSYTFGMNEKGNNWQIYTGIGSTWNEEFSFAWQAGARYCFNTGYLDNTETWSLSAGLSYLNREFVPTIGVNVMPTVLQVGDWWEEKEDRYPHHYGELLGAYGSNGLLLGANYAYMPSKIGVYGSFLLGFEEGDILANVGPILRLNSSENWPVDIQIFQGIGYSRIYHYDEYDDYEEYNGIGGETGIRFGFGRDRKYGMWSLSTSAVYSKDYIGATLGISWPIAGIAAASAGILLYAYAVATTGGTMPDISELGTSSSSSSLNASESKSIGGNCASYQKRYNDQEAKVIKQYQDMDWMAHRGGGSTQITRMNKTYHNMQKQLKHIRLEARKNGCTISQSSWETKSWNGTVRSPFSD